MKTAHEVIRAYRAQHQITQDEINEYMRNYQVPEEEQNVYDSRYLMHLEQLVEERNAT